MNANPGIIMNKQDNLTQYHQVLRLQNHPRQRSFTNLSIYGEDGVIELHDWVLSDVSPSFVDRLKSQQFSEYLASTPIVEIAQMIFLFYLRKSVITSNSDYDLMSRVESLVQTLCPEMKYYTSKPLLSEMYITEEDRSMLGQMFDLKGLYLRFSSNVGGRRLGDFYISPDGTISACESLFQLGYPPALSRAEPEIQLGKKRPLLI